MRILILTSLVAVLSGTFVIKSRPATTLRTSDQGSKVLPFTFPGMPIRIDAVSANSLTATCEVNYSVTNLGNDQINQVNFTIFIVDSDKVLSLIEGLSSKPIEAGAKQDNQILINREIAPNELALIAVNKAVSNSGIWSVDGSAMTKAVSASLNNRPGSEPNVKYESHTILTDDDRSAILELIVEDLLRDERKLELVPDRSRLIFMRERSDFRLPSVPDVTFLLMDSREIQELADKEGKVVYITYQPLVVEGSRVLARLTLRDAVARKPGIRVPYRVTFLYSLQNRSGRWKIERSVAHS